MTAIIQLLQKILEKVQSIAESGGGGNGFDVIVQYNFNTNEYESYGDFEKALAKIQDKKPVTALYQSCYYSSEYFSESNQKILNVDYDEYTPNKIKLIHSSESMLAWDANGVSEWVDEE